MAPSDDAASSPHQSDRAVVQGPAELFSRLPQQHEALRIGDDLGGVEGLEREGWFNVLVFKNVKIFDSKCYYFK